jgi:hypothetical protein
MDRATVTGMVEDYWRSRISAAQHGGVQSILESVAVFEKRIAQVAAALPPIEGAAFLQAVDADREKLLAEYEANPIAFKQRLGIELGVDGPAHGFRSSKRQGLGELAVRTVVRATIWESIWSLFRLGR